MKFRGFPSVRSPKITRGHVLHDAAPTKHRRSEVHDGSALRIRPKARLGLPGCGRWHTIGHGVGT